MSLVIFVCLAIFLAERVWLLANDRSDNLLEGLGHLMLAMLALIGLVSHVGRMIGQ